MGMDSVERVGGERGSEVSERRDGISVSPSERMEDCSRAFCHDFKRRLWVGWRVTREKSLLNGKFGK